MLRGKTGFGGTTPCAQTAGERIFYEEFQNPVNMLLNGDYNPKPLFFGANSHEGSFIYQSMNNRDTRLTVYDMLFQFIFSFA